MSELKGVDLCRVVREQGAGFSEATRPRQAIITIFDVIRVDEREGLL